MQRLSIAKKANQLRDQMTSCGISEKFYVICDGINGKTFAIAGKHEIREHLDVKVYTDYMSFDEFRIYLFGFKDCVEGEFNIKD